MSVKLRAPSLPILLLAVLFPILSGCTTDPSFQEHSVVVTAVDLPPLDPAEGHYELWFSYPEDAGGKTAAPGHGDAEFVSMGTFVVDAVGALAAIDGGVPSFVVPEGYNPALLIDAILTVEPPDDTDDEPHGRLLAGTFAGTASLGVATLTLSGPDAFGRAFDSVNLEGEYQLFTPSTASNADNAQGIWFLGLLNDAGLGLRPHPINLDNEPWTYESWLISRRGGGDVYISLGPFDTPAAKDANGAGPNAGPDAVGIDVPGEDFVAGTVRTLNDGTYGVLVSLQPKGPNVGRPFLPLMRADTIPPGLPPFEIAPLRTVIGAPAVEISVER